MTKPTTLIMDDGSQFAVVPADHILALEARIAELEAGAALDEGPPPQSIVTKPWPAMVPRAGYYPFECDTNAKNRFPFVHGGGAGRSYAARGFSRFLLFNDPDGAGPDRPAIKLRYVDANTGETVAEPLAYGQIALPDGTPPGEYALEIDCKFSEADESVKVTLYPHG